MHGGCLSKHFKWNEGGHLGEMGVRHIMCAQGIQCVLLFSRILCVFMSSHIMVFVSVPVPVCVRALCVACPLHTLCTQSLCVSVKRPRRAVQQRALLYERMPEWVCHRERKLEEKGDCGERETFPRHPQSVRLIKSHGWSESWETEPEHAGGAWYDSKEIKKEIATCKY